MPSFGGAAALALLNDAEVDVPFIIVSGTVTEELATNAMRSGARDWVLKGKLGRLLPAIDRELAEAAERKRAAEALHRSEERLRRSRRLDAIGGLAAGVAHDFNNVLSVIIGHAELLSADLQATSPLRGSVDEIRAAASRAADLTRQLLAFSRQQILQPRRMDLAMIVSGMEKMLRPLIGEDLELSILASGEEATVLVDPGQMEQVIVNLVVNARDAMPRGGELTLETRNVDVGERESSLHADLKPGAYVNLIVKDTGVGMDAATRARIFEPFFTTKEAGRGTGLGLATVLGIVQQSGGTISTISSLGRGTTFSIYLPRVHGPASPEVGPTDAWTRGRASPSGHETVLLVEDDESVRALLRTVLQNHGYRVLDAAGGREALLVCQTTQAPIDLVLTDVVMPQMSGPDFAASLEALRPGTEVLYMSGYTDRAIVHHGVLEPGIEFLQKPVTPLVLVDKVREMLGRRPQRKP